MLGSLPYAKTNPGRVSCGVLSLSHAPMLDPSEGSRKPLEAILAPLAAGVPDLVLPRAAYLVC